MIQSARQLVLAAHQSIEMDLNVDILELRQGRVGQCIEGLAGRIREQVNMKFFLHRLSQSLHGDSEAWASIPPPEHKGVSRAGRLCMTGG